MCLVILSAQIFEVWYDVLKAGRYVRGSKMAMTKGLQERGGLTSNIYLSDRQRNINQHTIRFPPLKIGVNGDECDNAVSLEINGEISIAEAYRDRFLDLKLWRFVRK